MQAGSDDEEKTLPPTPKKIDQARERGQLPVSREVINFGGLLGILIVGFSLESSISTSLFLSLRDLLDSSGSYTLRSAADLFATLSNVSGPALTFCCVCAAALTGMGLLGNIAQNPPKFASSRVTPQLSRVSIRGGCKRIFGKTGLVDFFRISIKFIVFLTYILIFHFYSIGRLDPVVFLQPTAIGAITVHELTILIWFFVLSYAILSITDLFLVRRSWLNDLRMSHKEQKDELKESDGDPLFKSYRRSVSHQRNRRRMMASVPQATMIIMNPTHYAVALQYVKEKHSAPVVIAKGRDNLALRLREIAREASVPVIENKPLAQALYKTVEVDQRIPVEFYKAIAEILTFLQRRRRDAKSTLRPA